jgi:hypothetical protein
LVEKVNKFKNFDERSHIFNCYVTPQNFPNLYETEIKSILKTFSQESQKALLFGLHSCGNLTSDTLKIFLNSDFFSHVVIVGCCVNLLKEYISEAASQTEEFKTYIKSIGYDSKGNFLEQTLINEYSFDEIGYPLSKHILSDYPEIFLSRTVRNSSMQSLPKKEDKLMNSDMNIFYRKILYRTMLQSFFEKFIPEMKLYYGFGRVDLKIDDSFDVYLKTIFSNINYKKDQLLDFVNRFLNQYNFQEEAQKFSNNLKQYESVLWAVYLIRLKFSRIVEYIIALDRINYLKENGICKIELVKIFDENLSVRNLLICASKN